MDKKELEKEGKRSVNEAMLAWNEFFKDKPEPKNDEDDRKQQEEFYHWYNYERKQSDTGKTPAEMYKELYGEEPPKNFPISADKPSRIMNFEWEEDDELDGLEEPDSAQEEAIATAGKIFEKTWSHMKREVEGTSKKDACRYCFITGFLNYMWMMDKQSELIENKMKNMSKEELGKMVDDFKHYSEDKKDKL